MKQVIVVDRIDHWPFAADDVELVTCKKYLRESRFQDGTPTKVISLSRGLGYQSLGYYVSLLAHARKHQIVPSAARTQDVKNRGFLDAMDDEIPPPLRRTLPTADKVVFRVWFGATDRPELSALAERLYRLLQVPVFEATFRPHNDDMVLTRVAIPGDVDWTDEDRAQIFQLAAASFARRVRTPKLKAYRFDLAILHDPEATDVPSNPRALQKFVDAAESLDIRAEYIAREDYGRLFEFDGLFIRATTNVNHYTYRFARRAQAEGLVVMDDPDSILWCTNKVYLAELLATHKVPQPNTQIITEDDVDEAATAATFPLVLKRPDGSFSLGSYKVHNPDEFRLRARELLSSSELILGQPFLESDYDWRIGVLDGVPYFACRYFMAKGHWQIIKRVGGKEIEGDHQTIPVENAPPHVVKAAVDAARLIGDGLYGVDLKEIAGAAYVIEVNDNPNLDAGVEDQILKDELYRRLMRVFLTRMERAKTRRPKEVRW